MKKIVLINGHPNPKSLSQAFFEAYRDSAKEKGEDVFSFSLHEMEFELNLKRGYKEEQALENDLLEVQKAIKEADKLVFFYPVWWGNVPALLKGFVDRTFLPGFAFKYHKGNPFPEGYLKGKSAELFVTMDSPWWYYRFFQGGSGDSMMKRHVLKLSGISPVKFYHFQFVKKASPEKIKKWIEKVQTIAAR